MAIGRAGIDVDPAPRGPAQAPDSVADILHHHNIVL